MDFPQMVQIFSDTASLYTFRVMRRRWYSRPGICLVSAQQSSIWSAQRDFICHLSPSGRWLKIFRTRIWILLQDKPYFGSIDGQVWEGSDTVDGECWLGRGLDSSTFFLVRPFHFFSFPISFHVLTKGCLFCSEPREVASEQHVASIQQREDHPSIPGIRDESSKGRWSNRSYSARTSSHNSSRR